MSSHLRVYTDTLAADFESCGVLTNAVVTNGAGGEIRLRPLFEDYFDGTQLNTTLWEEGRVNEGVNVDAVVSNGVITLNNSWIRSFVASCSLQNTHTNTHALFKP